jgi:RNA polymerase sigma factor (sigma-70 family)
MRLLASAPSAGDHVPDAELLHRFVALNDSAAFELIVRRHADAVWVTCRRMLSSDADAEDAFQATFLALIRKARAVRTPCAGGWLHRVAVNAALKLRARAARSSPTEPAQLIDVPSPSGAEPDRELAAAVHEELTRLPERERLPIVLCDLEGLSHADAARTLGWPIGTVSGRLSRARAKLRARLERRGLTRSAVLFPALVAPPHLVPNAVLLTTSAVSPAIVSLTEGALAMMMTTWKWVPLAVVCSSALGAGAVLALGPGVNLLPPNGAPGLVHVAADNPAPRKDAPADEEWLPKLDDKLREVNLRMPKNADEIKVLPTAFPELALLEPDQKDLEYHEKREAHYAKLCPRLAGKTEIVIEPTDDTLRKLLKAKLHQGVSEIRRLREVVRIGAWPPQLRNELIECLTDMQVTALELWGGQPKELIPWLEELVVMAKEMERMFWLRVVNGNDPPQTLNAVRRFRFGFEITLLKAKRRA